jgi:hypothetical protein
VTVRSTARSAAARLLRSGDRMQMRALMFFFCVGCVFESNSLRYEPITHSEELYAVCVCVCVCVVCVVCVYVCVCVWRVCVFMCVCV